MMVFTLASRELRSLFLSPLAWSVLAVVLFIHAYLFLTQLNEFLALQSRLSMIEGAPGATEFIVTPLFGSAAFILLLVVPLITMRLISEERRNQTLPLLFSAPLSMTEIILGKYVGVVAFLWLMLGLISLMPLSLTIGAQLDMGLLLAGILGLALLLAAFAAVGLFMSTLTVYPAVAAIATFGMLLLLWIIDWAGNNIEADGGTGLLSYLSLLRHYEALLRGLFNSADIIYYLLFITVFVVLSIRRLDADRLPN